MSIPINKILFILYIYIPGYSEKIKEIQNEFLRVFYQKGRIVKSTNVPKRINMMVYDTKMAIKLKKGWSRPHVMYTT